MPIQDACAVRHAMIHADVGNYPQNPQALLRLLPIPLLVFINHH